MIPLKALLIVGVVRRMPGRCGSRLGCPPDGPTDSLIPQFAPVRLIKNRLNGGFDGSKLIVSLGKWGVMEKRRGDGERQI